MKMEPAFHINTMSWNSMPAQSVAEGEAHMSMPVYDQRAYDASTFVG
jgi:hypothetical protein